MPIKKRYALNQSPLYKLGSRPKLARLLGVTNGELRRLAAGDALYNEFDIPKKSGTGFRHVENPVRPLKLLQAKLARLLARIEPPDFLFCPVKGRCYITNAAAHRGNRMVQCLDLEKFFPSTTQKRVYWFFHKIMHCDRTIAALLAQLSCYQQHLPTGSPLSPIVAYFAYYDLWHNIDQFCRERGYVFTVYVDDVTISGVRVPESDVWQVKQMIHRVGLRYHKEKTFVDRAAEVTGVVLRDGKLVAPFRQHKKLHETMLALSASTEELRVSLLGTRNGVAGQLKQIAAKN
ncbi:reverse transcriptase family protein [uncultured Sphingomonas sp.]|uniref:reverse transcriptase family protein n=1 Tax=uncultured Sphingomonas sp. TaxID=158754 RepID=UPI0025E12C6A|nr:reverse transcriptase family protein [uncultured Sphingomonas sp.]